MNTKLMTHVERAVRPLRTHHAQKMRLRDELYSLLADIHEDERKRDDNEETAVASAIRRFGPAESLTAELQETLTWLDRLVYWEGHLLRQRPGESILRHAARAALVMLLVQTASMLPIFLLFRFTGGSHDGERVGIALMIGVSCGVFLATPLAHAAFRCFVIDRWRAATVAALALLATASSGLVLLIGFVILWFSSLDLELAIMNLWSWVAPALLAGIALPASASILLRTIRREEPWTTLELD